MFLIDYPYVSDFLRQTIDEHNFPVVQSRAAISLGFDGAANRLSEAAAIDVLQAKPHQPIYTNSENAIGWVAKNLGFSHLPAQVALFKDKIKFRRLLQPHFPDFFFQAVPLADLDALPVDDIPLPCIVKPAVGFFSVGVHKVSRVEDWPAVKQAIREGLVAVKQDVFPDAVLQTEMLIIERCIPGDEFAVDAYFDANGEPVILNVLQHMFSSADDVSDRIYISSAEILETYLAPFQAFLQQIAALTGVTNFPVHVELRLPPGEGLVPIEINPLRFGGWCTTADLTALAYGFNPYVYYLSGQRPDWATLLADKADKIYSLVVLDNSTGLPGEAVAAFDYDAVKAQFENPLELRRLDYRTYPVFGFVFTETRADNLAELEAILKSDLCEFVTAL